MAKLIRAFEQVIGRRGFIGRIGVGAGAFAGALFGMSKRASAADIGCCELCYPEGTGYWCVFAVCNWSWQCCHGGEIWGCYECYMNWEDCENDGCGNSVVDSLAVNLGSPCE